MNIKCFVRKKSKNFLKSNQQQSNENKTDVTNQGKSSFQAASGRRLCVGCGKRRAQMKVIDDNTGEVRLLCTICAASENIKPPAPKSVSLAPHVKPPAGYNVYIHKERAKKKYFFQLFFSIGDDEC